MHMYLDVVGSCDLKCPACPVGNSENKNSKKAMTLDLFNSIVAKAKKDGVTSIHLYNWTEPLIHPKIGSFIEIVQRAGISCGISSNLNVSKNIEVAIRAEPEFFRISLSGFTQDIYQKGHAGGDIEKVKENMRLLSSLCASLKVKTRVEVYYHRYLDNIYEEEKMKAFSESLGFHFSSEFASLMPLEKTLAVAEGVISKTNQQDILVMERLAIPPNEKVLAIARSYGVSSCALKDGMIVLDCEGNVILCCAVFEQKNYAVGSYLEYSIADIQVRKNNTESCRDMCTRCMHNGLHVYALYPNRGPLVDYALQRSLIYHAKRLMPNLDIESVSLNIKIFDQDFDEQSYLDANPDVASAVSNGVFHSGYHHYSAHGKNEDRGGVLFFGGVK
jgi:MoaA/NifB/PqqE/SkfB family radical SAM enzyme